MTELPDSDQFFGSQPQLPDADSFFAPKPPTAMQATGHMLASIVEPGDPSPAIDEFMKYTPVGRITKAFTGGASSAFNGSFGLQPDDVQELKKAGIFNDVSKGEDSFSKSIAQALIRPAAVALDAAQRTLSAPLVGYQAAAKQLGEETGSPQVGSTLADLPMAFPTGLKDSMGIPHQVIAARATAVIGEGEAGYFGLKEPTLEQAADRQAAHAAVNQPPEEPVQPPAPDIHQIARNIAPETFQKYDALDLQKQDYRSQLDELSDQRQKDAEISSPHADEIAELKEKLEDANPRKTKIYQARLDELESLHEDHIANAVSQDTPAMADIRQKLQEADYAQRDMAPEVSAAYRTAQEHMPEEVQNNAAEELPSSDNAVSNSIAEETTKAPSAELPATENKIAELESQKIQAAGRPKDEADAAAALVAAHYEARAQRFGGAKGSAQEMYERDGANVKAGKGKVKARELAQSAQGKIRLATDDARATITLMKSANASTFIHETGHHWLDELMRDAEDEHAPDDLKKDAQTVRDWMGNKGGNIETRQHEKFARGFERYMMEGTAPSKALANVFAKFKSWLTSIYQTVDKLRSPITDDIRDVFDRLLSNNPEKTVIAPDHEPGKMMADIHEADAVHTQPAEARVVGDKVEGEIDRTAKLHEPEIADAIKSGETANIAEPTANDTTTGTATEQPTGAPSPIKESGPVTTSGGDATAEGSGIRSEPASGDNAAREKQQPGANTTLGRPDGKLVDKAGNIRLDNLSTPEDVNTVIKQTADDNEGFMGARRGVISDAQVLDLADALGMDAETINTRKIGQAYNAEQIMAARKLLIQSAESVRDSMAKAATGSEADVMAYAQAKARHRMIQEQVSGITAEAGRALRAFRKIEGQDQAAAVGDFLKQATGKDLFQLQEEAKIGAALQTPQQISKFVNDTSKSSLKDAVIEYYVNSLISGPITHMRYAVGNAVNALWTPLVETPFSAALGATHGGDRVYLGESGAQLYALGKGSRDGLQAAIAAWKTGNSPLLPMEGKEGAVSMIGAPEHAIPGKVGEIINLPSKGVSAIHSFFKTLRYEQNIAGMAYRQAMKEGLDGANMEGRIAQLTKSPTEDMMKSATENALKELYMAPTEYHSAMGALTRFTNQSLAAKIIVPFMKIGSQITRNAFLERTPLGFLDKEVRANLLGVNGAVARDFQAAKIMAGTALIGASVGMALEGNMTGDGPTDPSQRAVWLLNHRPNSIQIGNITIPYQGLGSLGMLMRFSANMTETAHAWGDEDGSKVALSGLEGITKSVLDENFMRGVKDMLDAVYHPEEYGDKYIQGFVTNWLPFSVGMSQVARQIDPVSREVQSHGMSNAFGIMDAARAKIPFVSEGLSPRRDMFGNTITPGNIPNYAQDPVVQRMNALQMGVGRLERKIRGVQLTDQQYDDFGRLAGKMAKMRLDAVVSQSGFANIPAGTQIQTIKTIIDSSRETARSIIMMQNPDIMQKAMEAKKLSATTGKLH